MKKSKRILVIPDIHGCTFWKQPVQRFLDHVDRIVFLGDYLDPYEEDDGIAADIFDNLLEIIELKRRHPRKVILLKGNHDEHYSSTIFRDLAGGSRMDKLNWNKYNKCFNDYKKLFKIAHLETINETPYLFSHAGITEYWLNKVNSMIWHINDNGLSVAEPDIIKKINTLDTNKRGQEMLSVIGKYRSFYRGEETGSILWADVSEHPIPSISETYCLNKVFQVFGHSRIGIDMIQFENNAMIDSQQCFMIDDSISQKIVNIHEYERLMGN